MAMVLPWRHRSHAASEWWRVPWPSHDQWPHCPWPKAQRPRGFWFEVIVEVCLGSNGVMSHGLAFVKWRFLEPCLVLLRMSEIMAV